MDKKEEDRRTWGKTERKKRARKDSQLHSKGPFSLVEYNYS
jgi:hypothetical protein